MSVKFSNYAQEMPQQGSKRTRYRWRVFVDEPADVLDKIRSVEYQLHSTFANPVRVSDDRAAKFAIQSAGWGEFDIKTITRFQSGVEERSTYHLNLAQDWPESTVDVAVMGDVQGLPLPQPGETITSADLALASSCWR